MRVVIVDAGGSAERDQTSYPSSLGRPISSRTAGSVRAMEPLARLAVADLVSVTRALSESLDAHSEGLDRLDARDGLGGDTGSNLSATLAALTSELDRLGAVSSPTAWADSVRRVVEAGGVGRAGRSLLAFLEGFASVAATRDSLDGTAVALGIEAGAEQMGGQTSSTAGGNPMMSVADAASAAALACVDAGERLPAVVIAAADAALDRLESDAAESEYADEGGVDPGSAGLCVAFDVLVAVVHGDPLDVVGPDDDAVRARTRPADPLYTFSCSVEIDAGKLSRMAEALGAVAHPLDVTIEGDVARVEAGVDDLGALIEAVCSFGRPRAVVVEDRRSRA